MTDIINVTHPKCATLCLYVNRIKEMKSCTIAQVYILATLRVNNLSKRNTRRPYVHIHITQKQTLI